MNEQSIDQWVTKMEARERTGLSERTLERKIQEGELRREFRPIPGRKPLAVLHPDDVAKLEERTLKPVVVNSVPSVIQPQPDMSALLSVLSPTLPVYRKIYLTLDEAAQYSGLPKTYLRRQIATGGIRGVKAGGWKIKREELERHDAVMTA